MNGKDTENMTKLKQAFMLIPPTSVEAERVFSASGLFMNKLRCRLSDTSLDMLIFLKFHFLRSKC